MTSPHEQVEPPLVSRTTHRSILVCCILFVICIALIQGDSDEVKGFEFASGVHNSSAAAVPKLPREVSRSSSIEKVTTALRRLLLGDLLQHYTVVGLLNEDGALSSEFISSGKFVDEEGWEEAVRLSGEGFDRSVVAKRRHPEEQPEDVAKTFQFEMCPSKMKHFIPCLDDVAAIKQLPDAAKGEQWERHCPHRASRMCCIIAPPAKYKVPISWPRSQAEVWAANIPRPRRGWNESWITIQKDKFRFPTPTFPTMVDGYLDQLAQHWMWVAESETLGPPFWLVAFCPSRFAKGSRTNGVQLALERGIPAMVAVFARHRLLFPSQAFDMIHCSDCEVQWTSDGRLLLIESDRLLRAGGYFMWAAAPSPESADGKKTTVTWHEMDDLARLLCWTLVAKGLVVIWQKPYKNHCYEDRAPGTLPLLCDESDDPDAVWYVPLKQCITRLLPTNGNVSDWPARLSLLPERLGGALMYTEAARLDVFVAEQRHWNETVSRYLRDLGLKKEHVRNVMDMRAGYGGFAAALADQQVHWWVMNVVPPHRPNSLPVIYDRGLLGVVHDWCEPFDTYPRTYDLLHAVGLFSAEESRCKPAYIILEMDRILRPGGWVLIRESKAMARKVEALAKSVHWKTRILETESGPYGKDKLLSCIKRKR